MISKSGSKSKSGSGSSSIAISIPISIWIFWGEGKRQTESEGKQMGLGHEKLDVYRLAMSYVEWVYQRSSGLNGVHRTARDQWLRASQSVPLNIAEGNGKSSVADRRRYFEIARGSTLECAAIQDVLVAGGAIAQVSQQRLKSGQKSSFFDLF